MVYNEKRMLPIWRRYFGGIFGSENLFILDHGSNDDSTENLRGENRIKLFRETFSNADRVRLISKLHESLLAIYDYAIYTDCDEFLVADLGTGRTLKEFIEVRRRPYFTPVGLNLVHLTGPEGKLNDRKPILSQRRHVQFVSPMMKTLISSVPITWKAGFQSSTVYPFIENDLYLFHLKRFDLSNDLARTKITRSIVRPESEQHHGAHQRHSD
ncbi:MAG: glycosyltransferase family 2 protein [Pseudomonadota bacterium]